uniref:Nuclear envelope integral membrane protein 1 n=1 Tax=Astyanax mexicanus TaxID=7994 RepID=W5KD71_ASTMX
MAGLMKLKGGSSLLRIRERFTLISLLFILQLLQLSSGVKRNTIDVKDGQEVKLREPQHFCYINPVPVPGWKETWMRIQVQVWSSKELKVTVVNDEEDLEELEHFSIWGLVQYFVRERTNETTVSVSLFSPKTCFRVDPSDSRTLYTVKPSRKYDIFLFLVFIAGVLLFFFADTLSRSQLFYYSAGMSTGLIASLIILIFVLGRFLPKKSSFYVLIVGGWSFALYLIQLVFKNLQVILKEHWHLAIAYVAVVGFVSFAVCYRHGPLVEERSINILSWTLQLFGMLLIYAGIQVQQVALAIMVAAFCSKNLEYPVTMPNSPIGVGITIITYCDSVILNIWFADFVEGSPHLMSNEMSVHCQEYGVGGSFFEDELFATDEEDEEEEEQEGWETEDEKPNISSLRNSTPRRS